MRFIRLTALVLIGLLTLLLTLWWGVAQYFNREQPAVSKAEAQASLQSAIGWMKNHEADVLSDGNQALWRMVHQAAELTHNPDLARLYASYYERYYQRGRTDVWERWLTSTSKAPLTSGALENLEAYQHLFVYAITCDESLGSLEDIGKQLSPDYCAPALVRALRGDSTCSTHQLMGLSMMIERGCGNTTTIKQDIPAVQSDIVTQLHFDPRVRDAYIQRVLMLHQTGASSSIRPVWLRRVIHAQMPDGGWAGGRSIKLLAGDLAASLGHGGTALSAEENHTDFHATAQGLLLMSLVVADLTRTSSP